jgi:hypothetical protein
MDREGTLPGGWRYVLKGSSLKRVQDGETYDVVWIARAGIDSLVKDGKVIASTATVVIMVGAKEVEASKLLINFLRSPEATAVIKAMGMRAG